MGRLGRQTGTKFKFSGGLLNTIPASSPLVFRPAQPLVMDVTSHKLDCRLPFHLRVCSASIKLDKSLLSVKCTLSDCFVLSILYKVSQTSPNLVSSDSNCTYILGAKHIFRYNSRPSARPQDLGARDDWTWTKRQGNLTSCCSALQLRGAICSICPQLDKLLLK